MEWRQRMQSRILNYVDFEKVNSLLEGFNQVTGFVTAILDLEGNVLSQSGWRQICTDFHRINVETAQNCRVSDTVLANELADGKKYHFYKCLNGLVDVAIPIVIKGEHIANLFSGQFFFEEPDVKFFRKQAKNFGFDEIAYLEALAKVPVVSEDEVEERMKFLVDIIQMISELTLEKIEQLELNEALITSKNALSISTQKLELNMIDLMEAQRIAHMGTWRLDITTNEVVWTDELYKMYGFDPTMPPPSLAEHMKLFKAESWDKLSTALEIARTTGVPYELELETVMSNGMNGWMWVSGEAIRDSEGNIVSLRGVAQDITQRKIAEEELFHYAFHDHLTGLYNRRYFEQELNSLDTEENLPLSIIMCDLNGLKLMNDSFGHEFGDKLLIKAAQSIKQACSISDIVARIGGDEFAVILPNTDVNETALIVENIRLLASIDNLMNIELSISYGSDTKATAEQPIMDMLVSAENLMYKHKLYERMSMRSNIIDLIMNTLFEKSNRELQHSARVGSICQAIASEMHLDKGFADKMRVSGLIHDIGKIGIAEKILNKAGSLSGEERKAIEGHPEAGWRILSSTDEFSELAEYVRDHHEKWDGSGYPNKLKGEKISLEARIIAVADSYDAMTSERTYKKAFSKEEAMNELKHCSGTHFDPKIVEVFINKVLPYKIKFEVNNPYKYYRE